MDCIALVPFIDNSYLPLSRVINALDSSTKLRLPSGAEISVDALQGMFADWKTLSEREVFDGFISYRWGKVDEDLTSNIFNRLGLHTLTSQNRQANIFLDKVFIKIGDNLKQAFSSALLKSSLVIPIVSANALTRMMTHDPQEEDNVIIEWLLTLEAVHSKQTRVKTVLPIVIGSWDALSETANDFFQEKLFLKLPATIPTASIQRVEMILQEHDITPRPTLASRTVAKIVAELLEFIVFNLASVNSSQYISESCRQIVCKLSTLAEAESEVRQGGGKNEGEPVEKGRAASEAAAKEAADRRSAKCQECAEDISDMKKYFNETCGLSKVSSGRLAEKLIVDNDLHTIIKLQTLPRDKLSLMLTEFGISADDRTLVLFKTHVTTTALPAIVVPSSPRVPVAMAASSSLIHLPAIGKESL